MAEKKKKKSRLKKFFKNLAKVAAVGAAGYGASKLFGGKKNVETGLTGSSKFLYSPLHRRNNKFLKSGAAGGASIAHLPVSKPFEKPNMLEISGSGDVAHPLYPYKKGGRVTGIAKRGFGRALMKGKK